jgi:predicted DsbA family dithiol-disulfide isomerase
MTIEIWSDVMCPFCYIGKRRLEKALKEFSHKEEVQIIWKSFQLNPNMKTDSNKNINQYLSEIKGWSLDYARQVNEHVTSMAAEEGLKYNFDTAIVANSFDAHRLVQMAKAEGKGGDAEEQLFKAYFTDGKNTGDHTVLVELGKAIGMNAEAVKKMLETTQYTEEVQKDIYESRQVGVRGVPFFLIDKKYAISGAQDHKVFLDTLEKAWTESKNVV